VIISLPGKMYRFALNIAQRCLAAGSCRDLLGAYSTPPLSQTGLKGDGEGQVRKGK